MNNGLGNLISAFKAASNPQAFIMQMAGQNPQIASIMQEVQQNGGDAKALFYRKAKEMGIDPDFVLQQIR